MQNKTFLSIKKRQTQIHMRNSTLLRRRQNTLSPINLDPLILATTNNTNRLVPASTKHLDTLTTNTLAVRFPAFLQTLPRDRVNTLSNNTVLVCLCRPDIPDPACTVVASTDEAVGAVGVARERDNGIRVTAQRHGGECRCRRTGVDERDVASRRTRGQKVDFGEVFQRKKRVGQGAGVDEGRGNQIPSAQGVVPGCRVSNRRVLCVEDSSGDGCRVSRHQ